MRGRDGNFRAAGRRRYAAYPGIIRATGWPRRAGVRFRRPTMYYGRPRGAGALTGAGSMPVNGPSGVARPRSCSRRARSCAWAAAPLGRSRDTAGEPPVSSTSTAARLVTRPRAAGWAALGARHVIADGRVVVTGGSPRNNQLVGAQRHRADLEPGNQRWTSGAATRRARPGSTIPSPCCWPMRRSWSAAAAPAGRGNTTPRSTTHPICSRERRRGAPAPDHRAPTSLKVGRTSTSPSTTREDRAGDAGQDRLGHPQLQHGAALHGAAVPARATSSWSTPRPA